jgi:hypothetical protein
VSGDSLSIRIDEAILYLFESAGVLNEPREIVVSVHPAQLQQIATISIQTRFDGHCAPVPCRLGCA